MIVTTNVEPSDHSPENREPSVSEKVKRPSTYASAPLSGAPGPPVSVSRSKPMTIESPSP